MAINSLYHPPVSVVIGSFNRLPFLQATIETVRTDVADMPHEIIVVDGGSSDGTLEWLIAQKDVITIAQHNRGEWQGKPIERRSWGYFMNLGFKAASGTYICMLSDDCLVVPGAIKNGITYGDRQRKAGKKVGAVAFYWRNWPEQTDYWVGHTYGDRVFVNHGLYLASALAEVGYAEAEDYFFYHADGDICLKIWDAGYECLVASQSFIEHYSDANAAVRATNQTRQQADWKTYGQRWGHLGEAKNDGWEYKAFTDTAQTAQTYWKELHKEAMALKAAAEAEALAEASGQPAPVGQPPQRPITRRVAGKLRRLSSSRRK